MWGRLKRNTCGIVQRLILQCRHVVGGLAIIKRLEQASRRKLRVWRAARHPFFPRARDAEPGLEWSEACGLTLTRITENSESVRVSGLV